MITRRSRTTHSGGQLLTDSRMRLVPASYSIMDGRPTLPDDVDTSAPAVDMAGDHYFLGSVHPHFGHALLEGLARLWGLPDFLRQYPDGRLIVYEPEVPDFALELLKLAGVPLGRIKLMDQPLRVERLHVCDPALRTHHWVSAEQVRLWRQMAGRVDSGLNSGRRVFLSRRTAPARRLIDEEHVEHAFALAGYEIVAPETLSVVEQVRLAASAAVIAGATGSQMYLTAFQPAGRVLLMAPANFLYPDETLIANAIGHQIFLAFGSEIAFDDTARRWSISRDAVHALIRSAA